MTTSINSNVFAPTSGYDMKGLHVIEFITNDQPYPIEKLMAKLEEFQSVFQDEIEDFRFVLHAINNTLLSSAAVSYLFSSFSVGSSKWHSSPPEKDEDDDIEVEALVKKNAMIKSAIEKIRKATEEQEKQLRDKEEELQELYETIAELEELDEELDEEIYHDQPQPLVKFRRAK
ncbi:3816_t:CDS:2 [Acaulospora morrowiae]|uniref:3816_t:CDS:1 n=1 Tax=Acaulospora morrowiae TaxID=94023 RepID=A0A9N9FXI3_9GLOM|nr:3816_t:CDS:2 [Acaulospora morrowiae]